MKGTVRKILLEIEFIINNLISALEFEFIRFKLIKFEAEKISQNNLQTLKHYKPLRFYQTKLGNYYLPNDTSRDVIARNMKRGKIFEQFIVDVARRYITKGSVVLDVGSNFGQMSLIFSQLVGEEGQVFSFEADDYIFYVLEKNINANKCYNIKLFNKAVYNKTGAAMYYPVPDFKELNYGYGSYGLDPNATSGRTIETIAIDDLEIDREISFMKVDIQGSDLFAMEGAIQMIKKYKMPIIFEFEQQYQKNFNTSFQDYLDFIDSINYKVEEVIHTHNYLIVPKS